MPRTNSMFYCLLTLSYCGIVRKGTVLENEPPSQPPRWTNKTVRSKKRVPCTFLIIDQQMKKKGPPKKQVWRIENKKKKCNRATKSPTNEGFLFGKVKRIFSNSSTYWESTSLTTPVSVLCEEQPPCGGLKLPLGKSTISHHFRATIGAMTAITSLYCKSCPWMYPFWFSASEDHSTNYNSDGSWFAMDGELESSSWGKKHERVMVSSR
jgi:hypothetical protein